MKAAEAVRRAITEHADATPNLNRYELEKELKRQVRHPEDTEN